MNEGMNGWMDELMNEWMNENYIRKHTLRNF